MNTVGTIVARDKREGRYDVINRRSSTASKPRITEFDWCGIGIEDNIRKILGTGGRHSFVTTMLSDRKKASFHRAICGRARKLIGYNNDGTKRWRTERHDEAGVIILFVKKMV